MLPLFSIRTLCAQQLVCKESSYLVPGLASQKIN